jgi:hypothetical protein
MTNKKCETACSIVFFIELSHNPINPKTSKQKPACSPRSDLLSFSTALPPQVYSLTLDYLRVFSRKDLFLSSLLILFPFLVVVQS